MYLTETITAIATAVGESAIAIVRLSGDEALAIANYLFTGKDLTQVESHTIHYGHIMDPSTKQHIDEVLVSVFKAPKTFTTEDMVEINCHGGKMATERVLRLVLANGARLAQPGEFTKRAFLNGRIDLAQAEAVMDVIHAKTEDALQVAVGGVDGKVSTLISDLRGEILTTLANIEVNIDYPEYDDAVEMSHTILKPRLTTVQQELEQILRQAQTGKVIRDGIATAIVGRPNVGKSSLLNRLLQEERAIVTDIAGTTRDTVEGTLRLGHIILNLIDTAGIRETEDVVEAIGVEKSRQMIEQAQLTLVVLNNNEVLTDGDRELLALTAYKPRLVLINKMDLANQLDIEQLGLNNQEIIKISALEDWGLNQLEQKIQELFSLEDFTTAQLEQFVSNVRHIGLIEKASQSIQAALEAIELEMPIDLITVDIQDAWESLGEILGTEAKTDLIDELFSQFCLGK
ncbi:MAG: tRNA uridine-5-carboxymethylaminomethyl(34) synthesis GTPase MnmE [Culicoidibacterales bacterium]